MGQAKEDLEKKEEDNVHSKFFCSRCGENIPFDDLKSAKQGDKLYLCSHCRYEQQKLENE